MFSHKIDDDLELRLFEARHAEALCALVDANRDYLRAWLPWVDNTQSVDDSRAFIRRGLQRLADNNGFDAGIWIRGELVGGIGFHEWDFPDRKTEIGYWLAQNHTGKGVMTRAVAALLDYSFEALEFNRVVIQCAVDNVKSCAIPLRLGFTLEGVLRQSDMLNGQFLDMNVYSILRDEWLASKNHSSLTV
jgi:ribosomal-protein-serine acetyltransferase